MGVKPIMMDELGTPHELHAAVPVGRSGDGAAMGAEPHPRDIVAPVLPAGRV